MLGPEVRDRDRTAREQTEVDQRGRVERVLGAVAPAPAPSSHLPTPPPRSRPPPRSSGMKWWIRCRVLKVGSQQLYRGKCVYLFNHRSWADFIVDQYVTEGRSLFMSR